MATGLIDDPRFEAHDTGRVHPESPRRLQAIRDRLERDHLLEHLVRLDFEPVPLELLARVHDPAYIQRVREACLNGKTHLDSSDTPICDQSFEIARLASGAAIAAVDAVMRGDVANAFCAIRPPGHHAEHDLAMGFCLFNHIALAARHLIDHHRLGRVAIVDFDVHHGNGTQHLFETRADVLFISLHGHPTTLYPGTGFGWETGKGDGKGATINLPVEPGAGDEVYRALFDLRVIPALDAFEPQFLLLSSGFDAARDDPLANMQLTPDGYAMLTRKLMQAAARHCDGAIVSLLEGGYNLRALAECAAAHVRTLMDDPAADPLMNIKAGI